MSFAVWDKKPPFDFGKDDREQIYQVGDKWVVTDQGTPTQAQVDAVLNAPPVKVLTDGALAALLVQKNIILQADVTAATK